jgi:Tfp pilus assembly protein PilF
MQSNATTVPTLICLVTSLMFFGGCRSNMGQNGFGVSLFQQGRYSEALQQFELAKQSDPSNPDVYYNLASTYHRLGVNAKDAKMIETSEALYNQCLDLSPNHVDCHRGLAVLLVDSGRSEKAFSLLKNWTQRTPTLSDSRVELARLHQEFNQTKASEQYLDEALAMDPRNAKAWAAKGKLRENSGELMQAVQNYQQSLAINSRQPELFQRISALNVRIAQASSGSPGGPNVIAGNPGAPGATAPASNEPKRY